MKHTITFDRRNPNWSEVHVSNELFLRIIENHLNRKLEIRGLVFVNEVLEQLGFERTREGQTHGWCFTSSLERIVLAIGPSQDNGSIEIQFTDNGEVLEHLPAEAS